MNYLKSYKQNYILFIFIMTIFFSSCSDKKKIELKEGFDPHIIEGDSMSRLKKDKKKYPPQSYYQLDKLEFFGVGEGGTLPHIDLTLTLAFAKQDRETEKEIIYRRHQIKSFLIEYLSLKTYSELSGTIKREKLKNELLTEINQRYMKDHPIMDIYYTHFFVLPVKNYAK